MSTLFEPGSTSYRVGLAVSAIALALGTISQFSTALASFNAGSYIMALILMIVAALLAFGTYFNTTALVNDWNRYRL